MRLPDKVLKLRRLLPLAGLVLLMGSRWLFEGMLPGSGTSLASAVLGCLVAAGVFGGWAALRRHQRGTRGKGSNQHHRWREVVAGSVLLSAPFLARAVAGRVLNANALALAAALTPGVIAVAGPALTDTPEWDVVGRLWPGLAGLAGLLLLLPQPSYTGWRAWAGLVSVPLILGISAAVYRLLPWRASADRADAVTGRKALTCCLGAAVLLLLNSLSLHEQTVPQGLAAGALLDGTTFILSLLALESEGASAWSVQFLMTPLLVLLEGVLFLHPVLDVRSWLGLGLLVASSARQITVDRDIEAASDWVEAGAQSGT